MVTVADLNNEIRDRMNLLKTSIADDGTLNSFLGLIAKPEIRGYNETMAAIVAGSVAISLRDATYFMMTMSADVTAFSISHIAEADLQASSFTLELIGDGTVRTFDWFTNTVKWDNDAPPTIASALGQVGIYTFTTRAPYTTWRGAVFGQNFSA